MDITQIVDALERLFSDEHARIVFWNDPEQEFIESLPDIVLGGVEVINLAGVGTLETKVRIEHEDPTGRYLLYSPAEEPDYEEDWLLDIRLYSRSFRADRASIILRELGLIHQHLRQYITKRGKFFDNKERLQKLKDLISPEDLEFDLDLKLLAVIVKTDQAKLFNIVQALFHSMAEGDPPYLEINPTVWTQIERFELDKPFWKMVKSEFKYSGDSPSLKNFLIRTAGVGLRSQSCKGTTQCFAAPSITSFRHHKFGVLLDTMERQQQQGKQLQCVSN